MIRLSLSRQLILSVVVLSSLLTSSQQILFAQARLDVEPILYRATSGENRVKELFERVASGEVVLEYAPGYGNLESILRELEIPISSQVLVFSKTSLQAPRISPTNPRAFFFNDETVIGWIRGSSLMEIATADPKIGAAFYTVRMTPNRPSLRRSDNLCLGCHEATTDAGKVPVHMIRSVMTRDNGKINLLLDAFTTDHTSPISERWGGWYVSGAIGSMQHMGNAFLKGEKLEPIPDYEVDGLAGQIQVEHWPSPHSDIVALMVLEHQMEMHNRFVEANFAVRRAEYARDHETDSDDDVSGNTVDEVIDRFAERIVEYMLFCDEAKIDSAVVGASSFRSDFSSRGPFTDDGRSLRSLDLERRLFQHPCSYLIYSSAFDSLTPSLKSRVYQRLHEILTGAGQSDKYRHLTSGDRRAILSILRETKVGLPEYWSRQEPVAARGL